MTETFSRQSPIVFDIEIVQQPVRARMCGLGDKDRRQISPPAFIRVHPFDRSSRQAINVDHVDTSTLIMVVELWSADEKTDLSLNQNISTGDSSPEASLRSSPTQIKAEIDDGVADGDANGADGIDGIDGNDGLDGLDGPDGERPKGHTHSSSDSDESLGDVPTRNLIGSVVINGAKLYDEHHQRGIWFVLSDLSVRIEGEFKLKFKLVDLATNTAVDKFSQSFKVYSAKKFPGVVDSIALGRVFASQGVKIPIRREIKD